MPRTESVVSPVPVGAARSLDLMWPQVGNFWTGSVGLAPSTRIANNSTLAVNWTTGGNGSNFQFQYLETAIVGLRSNIINGGFFLTSGSFGGMRPRLGKSPVPAANDPLSAYRTLLTAAYSATPSVDCDYGIEFVLPANSANEFVIQHGRPGVLITRRSSGSVECGVRTVNAGAITWFPLSASIPGFVASNFNTYEFQIVSATATADATLDVLVNGNRLVHLLWGAGTILPVYQAAYPQMRIALNAGGDNLNDIYIKQWQLQASTTIQGCF